MCCASPYPKMSSSRLEPKRNTYQLSQSYMHSYMIKMFPSCEKIIRAYQKTMAIRDYFVIYLRSAITKLNQKTMAIDRNKSSITIIATGSRQDREDRCRIARISFQLNDGNTLLNTVHVSDKAQIFFLFSSC